MSYLFTSESVSEGHPDKICDQVSDAILDAYLNQDPQAKVACECLITSGQLIIAGEVSSTAHVDAVEIARQQIADIGYTHPSLGFDASSARYINLLHEQSREINASVEHGGAGDQGLMFGYACTETPELMPMPIVLSHRLMERQAALRKSGILSWLGPDAKSQVTVEYQGHRPIAVRKVVLSTQHVPAISQTQLQEAVISRIIQPVLQEYLAGQDPAYLINPSGSFTIGGPHGDTGLTGRKIIVDTYGGSCPHGGGAFSGKDPSKVDRSAAYAARYVAKHIVAAGLAERCTVQISFAIGVAQPTSLYVNTHDTGRVDDDLLAVEVQRLFDLTPDGITRTLKLRRPIYRPTASYGHFGKPGLPWEMLDEQVLNALRLMAKHPVTQL